MKITKLFKNENIKDTQKTLRSKSKWLRRRSIILAIFVFGVNIYAWFVFATKANLNVDADVMSWDLNFFDSNEEIKDAIIDVGKIYPGMETYTKEYIVKNKSDVQATFSYLVDKINIMGGRVVDESETSEKKIKSLAEDYPFIITLSSTKSVLDKNDELTFTIKVEWPYETANKFYKVTTQYNYDSSIAYYTFDGTNYNPIMVNAENFNTLITSGLYIEKDDADSYWGASCKEYKSSTGNSCVNFHVLLNGEQSN